MLMSVAKLIGRRSSPAVPKSFYRRSRLHVLECVEQSENRTGVFSEQAEVDGVELILEVFVVLDATVEDVGQDADDIPDIRLSDVVSALDVLVDTNERGNRIFGMGCLQLA